ncbi:MAG: endonuclease MutS2 [Clostridia bacterium]
MFSAYALDRIEWGRVLEILAGKAEMAESRRRLAALMPDPRHAVLEERHAAYREAQQHEAVTSLSLAGALYLTPLLDHAVKGLRLDPPDLLAVMRTIRAGAAMVSVLRGVDAPELRARFGQSAVPLTLARQVELAVDDDESIRDTASAELKAIRDARRTVEREIDAVFARILGSTSLLPLLQDALVTIRNGRRVVPVKHAHRNEFPGVAHDASGSGQTVFMEPMAVVERQNRLVELARDEADEIERILVRLTSLVAEQHDVLEVLSEHLVGLDTVLAGVRFGAHVGGVLPDLGGDVLDLLEARHPLLDHPVPVSLRVGGESPVLVVTGPNTGGKTVALKCAGLMTALALSGLPVPADSARVPLFQELLADIGDEQSLQQSLSTFSGHLRQLLPMVAEAGPGVLLLVDEIGAGTDPEEGAALAVGLVEHFLARGATVIVTTHFARLKLMAYETPGLAVARVEFDRERLTPTYRLVMGQAGASEALYIAERLGLPPALLERARELVGSESHDVQKILLQVHELERALREQVEESARERAWAAAERARDAEARAAEAERRQKDWEITRRRWRDELTEIRMRARQAIAAVREAEREERRGAVRELQAALDEIDRLEEPPAPVGQVRETTGPVPVVGNYVRGGLLNEAGLLVAIEGETGVVEAGALRLRIPVRDLYQVDAPRQAPSRVRTTVQAASPVTLECDLRGMTAADAVDEVDRYLDQALRSGAPFVRIIHGKGTGALRRAVHELLRGHPAVQAWRLGEVGEGGDGATVVTLQGQS